MNLIDQLILYFAPTAAVRRAQARMAAGAIARHYDAASSGRRMAGRPRYGTDVNAAAAPALKKLRDLARDAVRNDGWAARAVDIIADDTVGYGITARARKPVGRAAMELWQRWAGSVDCDADGMCNMAGLQALVMRTVVESGEALVRRRYRRAADGLSLPMQLQVLEPDFLDTGKNEAMGQQGGRIINGVEFDAIGRRVAYWLFPEHPGSSFITGLASRRVGAEDVLHVFKVSRPGQVRGASWLATALKKLNDFVDYEEATLVRQWVSACFAAFVENPDGHYGTGLGEDAPAVGDGVEKIQPGQVRYLQPGEKVSFGSPPAVVDIEFARRTLHAIANALNVTYEDLTGDYSQTNYSSARMSRLAYCKRLDSWRWRMLIPMFCDPVWAWAMDLAIGLGYVEAGPDGTRPGAEWIPPPREMIEPDKEGLALTRAVRSGLKTPSDMIRELGEDPDEHWQRYAEDFKRIDELGIVLDCDARQRTQAGQAQGALAQKAEGDDADPEDATGEPAESDAADEPEDDEDDNEQ